MSTLPVYLYGNDILKKKAKPVEEVSNEELKLIKAMFETMHESNGIGLAANQVGELKQILVVDISEMEAGKGTQPLVVINPEIVDEEGESEYDEGCLSIPDLRETVKRPERIALRYNDINMKEREMEADGLMARVLQHEIDHLNGVLFIDHLSAAKRTLLKSRLTKIAKGEVETSYEVVVNVPKKKKR